ncbi:MAG: U32 family peptidase [Candidatus Hadarchaeum sp.]|uniref:U32 family peptidase n=1 Tax=Candidatus Hadarchaeum sp. TaxID=2883567 RepID=UPI003D13622A
MSKVELVLPAGNELCLRAAVKNGADAVYLGLSKFNARMLAENFNEKNIFSAVNYCHERKVRVYVAFNTLVKNDELEDYFKLINVAYSAGADAIIIQDHCLIPLIRQNFPGLEIHLSTQATTVNSYSIPKGIDRVILARELSYGEVKAMSQKFPTEVFVHGALCFSYSGQCLFSSIAGGRSGNRGMCAQPCRKKYNNKYPLSTMDLCLLPKLPEIIEAGVKSLKVEGRLRGPLYVATVARIYHKYIDAYYQGNFKVDKKDIEDLMVVFNRGFTTGFAFNDNIVDSKSPKNRGLFLGCIKGGKLRLRAGLKIGDGVAIWINEEIRGYKVGRILKDGVEVEQAFAGDEVEIDTRGADDGSLIYKTSSVDIRLELGDEIKPVKATLKTNKITLPSFKPVENNSAVKIFAKVYNREMAIAAEEAGADVVYYDVLKEDCREVKNLVKKSRFFVYTPRIISDQRLVEIAEEIKQIGPEGVLVGNRGLLPFLNGIDIHLDYSFNCFNDVDLSCYPGIPIISPELNFREMVSLKNKRFIVMIHGDIVLMNSRQKLKAKELIDEQGRRFRVRNNHGITEILNWKQLGLFNKARDYVRADIKYFYIDVEKDVDRFIRIYRKILNFEPFDDCKIRKGYTTGHFNRGVI